MENFEKNASQNIDSLFLSPLSLSPFPPPCARAAGHSSTRLAAPLHRCARCLAAAALLLAELAITAPLERARRPPWHPLAIIAAPAAAPLLPRRPAMPPTPPFPLPARHCLPSYARTHAVDLGGARNAPAAAPRRRRRDKRAQPAPCLHPAPLPCRAPPLSKCLARETF